MGVNKQQYYIRLSRQRLKLLTKLEHIIAQLVMVGAPEARFRRVARCASRVQSSAMYYEFLANQMEVE